MNIDNYLKYDLDLFNINKFNLKRACCLSNKTPLESYYLRDDIDISIPKLNKDLSEDIYKLSYSGNELNENSCTINGEFYFPSTKNTENKPCLNFYKEYCNKLLENRKSLGYENYYEDDNIDKN